MWEMLDGSVESALPLIAVCALALGGLYGVTTRRGFALMMIGVVLSVAPDLASCIQHWLAVSGKGASYGRNYTGRAQRGTGGS